VNGGLASCSSLIRFSRDRTLVSTADPCDDRYRGCCNEDRGTYRSQLLAYDPRDYLTGWSNTAVAVWPKGKAPGAQTAY
jgi:hypothetical protein